MEILKSFPVKTISMPNKGWSHAVNQGYAAASGKWIIISNPDIIFTKDLGELLSFAMAHPEYPILAVSLLWPNGRTQPCRRTPRLVDLFCETTEIGKYIDAALGKPIYNAIYYNHTVPAKPALVDIPVASFLMISRDIITKTQGLLMEDFPIYFAEYDFFRRARNAGIPILVLPNIRFIHNLGHAAKLRPAHINNFLMLSGILHYCEKWRVHPRIFKALYLLNVFVSPMLFPVDRLLLRTRLTFKDRILVAAFQVKAIVLEKGMPTRPAS